MTVTNQEAGWGGRYHEGEARFRVWAPGVEWLALRIAGGDRPMARDGAGWFELAAFDVASGAEYSFVLPDGTAIPDPASRRQAGNVSGPSMLTDPDAYQWQNDWSGRPWEEAVIYELHIGAFTPEGTFRAAIGKLPHLAALGVTAIEIMPVAQFGGSRGWGYDGVLPYAPHSAYGSPDDMKALIDAAHGHGLMVLLDVVYNHFGPEGNVLPLLAPGFFHADRHTPWGGAIAYEQPPVRRFFIDNALYWLDEFRLDGLRFDAIDHIRDADSERDILVEIAEAIRAAFPVRQIHLTTEDNRNITRLHERGPDGSIPHFTAEWNDDFHNVAHVVATGEIDAYYEDFADRPVALLARALAEGFAYQGEPSRHEDGKPRGCPSAHLPPAAFVDFLQNHDQVGNRALGERLSRLSDPAMVECLSAILLLSPHIPLIFMGEEWGETRPFCFFTDFHGKLADAVREGRRREFAKFPAFDTKAERDTIPDPNAEPTFAASKLDWGKLNVEVHAKRLVLMQRLLALRARHIVPLLGGASGSSGRIVAADENILTIDWRLAGATLKLRANPGKTAASLPAAGGDVIYSYPEPMTDGAGGALILPPYGVIVAIERAA